FTIDSWCNIQLDSVIKKNRTEYDFAGFSYTHSNISSKTLRINQPLRKGEFIEWLKYTLDIFKNEIYRTKGMLCFENEPYEYILQGVGGSFEIVEGEEFIQSETSVIVFIGKEIPLIQFN
ncbi:MAG TPA: GTP-binding protein, partial [Draconibacterium sp.]|nr:GTP-binding protein [Draconibacterium sp.]